MTRMKTPQEIQALRVVAGVQRWLKWAWLNDEELCIMRVNPNSEGYQIARYSFTNHSYYWGRYPLGVTENEAEQIWMDTYREWRR